MFGRGDSGCGAGRAAGGGAPGAALIARSLRSGRLCTVRQAGRAGGATSFAGGAAGSSGGGSRG